MSWTNEHTDEGGVSIETRADAGTPTEPRDRFHEHWENAVNTVGTLQEALSNLTTDLYEVD